MSQVKLKTVRRDKPRRRLWIYFVLGLALVVLGTLATAYFGLTSNAFFQMFVVPKLSAQLRAEVKIGRAEVRPASEIRLEDIQLTPRGRETLLTAKSASIRANFWSFLGGQFDVEEIQFAQPRVTVIERLDGTRNLDPLLQALVSPPRRANRTASAQAEAAPLRIRTLKIINGGLQLTKPLVSGGESVTALDELQLTINDLYDGGTGMAELAAAVILEKSRRAPGLRDSLRANLSGRWDFSLGQHFQPRTVTGTGDFVVAAAGGGYAQFTNFVAHLKAEITPTEIKSLLAQFTQSGQSLGEIRLSGPLALAQREAKVQLEVVNLGSHTFNLLGAQSGLDFGETLLNASSELELAKNGTLLSVMGELSVARLQATRDGQSTPVVDLKCDYSLAVDQSAKSALLGSFNLSGTQNQKPLLRAGLTDPMTLAWGEAAEATGNATLLFSVSELNLAEWQPLLGGIAPAGLAKVEAKVNSQQTGRLLTYDVKLTADNLTLLAGSKQLTRLAANVEAVGESRDLQQFKLGEISGQLLHRGKPTLSLQGQAALDRPQAIATAEFTVLSSVSDLIPALEIQGADATSGALEFSTRFRQETNTQVVAGSLRIAGLSGMVGETAFLNYSTDVAFELARDPRIVRLRRFNGRIHEGSRLGGTFTLTGNYDRYTRAGEVTLRMADLNQHGLRPYLESVFGNRRVSAMSFNATAHANRNAAGDATLKTELQLTNLITIDLKTGIATTPLEFRAHLDAGLTQARAQINRGQITLTPTPRSKNILTLTGHTDLTTPTAIAGKFKVAADTLDLTKYLDLFGPKPSQAARAVNATTTTAPEVEPAAKTLPYRSLVGELNIGLLYAREVEATGLEVMATLENNQFYLRPCKVTLNGANVTATANVDFSEPGYRYELAFNTRELALAPLINSFQPERKGQVSGIASLAADLKGAGITSPNLQKNLQGQFQLNGSNLNLSLGNVRSPVVRELANTVVGVPELLRNPGITLENLVGRFSNFGAPRASWADDMMQSPLQYLEARLVAGEGKVRLENGEVRSRAFRARAGGDLQLAASLNNTALNLPVSLAVNHGLAVKVGLIPAGAPNDAPYYAMPDFLKLIGTLCQPRAEVNSPALLAVTVNASASLLKQLGINTSERNKSLIQSGGGAVGTLLGGQRNPAGGNSFTNAPAEPTKPKVFDLFGSPK